MVIDTADLTALIGAITALVVAIAGVIYQLRLMRSDIVSAVERHKDETISVLREDRSGDNPIQ